MTGPFTLKFATSFGFSKATRILAVSGLLIFVSACAGQEAYRQQSTPTGEGQPTGATTEVYDPDTNETKSAGYIAAGSKDSYVQLQNSIVPNLDSELAAAIDDVSITRLDVNAHITRSEPHSLQVKVQLKKSFSRSNMPVQFDMPLVHDGDRLVATNINQIKTSLSQNEVPLRASAFCRTLSCAQIELRIERQSAKSTVTPPTPPAAASAKENGGVSTAVPAAPSVPQAGLIYTVSNPHAEVLKPKTPVPVGDNSIREIEQRLQSGAEVTQESFSVVGGASRSKVRIDPNDAGTSAFEFETPVVDTAEIAPQVGQGRTSSNARTDVRILGIDPETSDMMVEVAAPTARGQVAKPGGALRFSIINEDVQPAADDRTALDAVSTGSEMAGPVGGDPTEIVVTAPSLTGKGLFPTTPGNDEIVKQSSRMAHYGKDSFVQTMIRNDSQIKEKVRLAREYGPKVTPYVVRVFEALGITPDLAYIMLIESSYLIDGNYNPLQITGANATGTAFGPWQILNMTAQSIRKVTGKPFQYSPVTGRGSRRVAPSTDDRGYLVQSSYMAASYLKYIIDTYDFKDEPIMAIVGYNRGDGYAGRAARQYFSRFKNYAIDFATVRRFNMVNAAGKFYAHKFLAFCEVGQNPEKYGIGPIIQAEPSREIRRLIRKGGPVPPNYFNERIRPL